MAWLLKPTNKTDAYKPADNASHKILLCKCVNVQGSIHFLYHSREKCFMCILTPSLKDFMVLTPGRLSMLTKSMITV